MSQKELRAEIYRVLSECYKEPCPEFALDVARGNLYDALKTLFGKLAISASLEGLRMEGTAEEILQKLKEEYYPLFVGPFPPFALPVESAYKEWSRVGEAPAMAAGVKGLLMGDPAIDMLRRYKVSGIEIQEKYKDVPDHLALLLEYMGFICEQGAVDEQKQFLQAHLDWLPDLKRLIYECSESPFYRSVADVSSAFADTELKRLNGEWFHDPLDQGTNHP